FRLAENDRILRKESDAVELYLKILKTDGDNPWKAKAKDSLLQFMPTMQDLASCYNISMQANDPQLKKMAQDRMKVLAGSFHSMENGYDFRRKFPSSAYESVVLAHMNQLAQETLNQAKLYQAIGEYQKALDEYNQIL